MLYLIATPIGNLKDLGQRALEVLTTVKVIICERPKQTRKLLAYYQLQGKRLIAYTEANKSRQIPFLLKLLESQDAALVADAGTVGVADPGPELIKAVRERGIKIVSVPGPSALTAAIALTGERINQFLFVGFLPRKAKELEKLICLSQEKKFWLVGFEAPHRLKKTLSFIKTNYPELILILVGEISKLNEKVLRGTAEALLEQFEVDPQLVKGEWVILAKFGID